MKLTNKLLIALTLINFFFVACGKIIPTAEADKNKFYKTELYGYDCITNGTALWCDR